MKISTAIAAATLAFTTPAQAETFELSRHGAWTVAYQSEGAFGPYCDMTNFNRNREGFVLAVQYNDVFDAYWSFSVSQHDGQRLLAGWENYEFTQTYITIGRTDWTVEIGQFSILPNGSGFVLAENLSYGFRQAMAQGSIMSMENDMETWSLNGSAAALRDLDACRRRLGDAS